MKRHRTLAETFALAAVVLAIVLLGCETDVTGRSNSASRGEGSVGTGSSVRREAAARSGTVVRRGSSVTSIGTLGASTTGVTAAVPGQTDSRADSQREDPGRQGDRRSEAQADTYDILDYGRECAELIAEMPPFNCLDGEIVPITVDGKTPKTYTRHMRCDRPAYLPYPEKTDGQCAPYTRIKAARNDSIQMVLYCRRMYIRPKDDPRFDSIEAIMHNVKTGSTCFFISKNFGEKPEGDDGRRVPPPTEQATPNGFISARELWATPRQTVNHGCIYCHDSDPWMHTPWIDQTSQVPSDPWGFHSVDVGGPFVDWPKPKSISTRGNSCTACHRIGSLNTCKTEFIGDFGEQPAKMLQSIGAAPHGRFGAARGTAYDSPDTTYTAWGEQPHGWMGTRLPDVDSQLWREYNNKIKDLQRCCDDHSAPGCRVEPIENMRQWLKRTAR